jgi:hypothetical protein
MPFTPIYTEELTLPELGSFFHVGFCRKNCQAADEIGFVFSSRLCCIILFPEAILRLLIGKPRRILSA